MTTYRYAWKGLDVITDLVPALNSALTVTATGPAPAPILDINLDSIAVSDKADLDAVMLTLGWAYQSTDPPAPPHGIILRQEVGDRVIADSVTVNDAGYDDLITVPITTEAGVLAVIASAVSTAEVTLGYMRVTVDGVPIARGAHLIGTANFFFGVRVPIAAGAHTVKLQWRTDVGGTQRVRPVAAPDAEFANLLVREMSG